MDEFFCSWQRKVGCVTLFLACVLSSLWIRSYERDQFGAADFMIFGASDWSCWTLYSRSGFLELARPEETAGANSFLLRIPHAILAIPLTIVSAWLVVSKNQKKVTSSSRGKAESFAGQNSSRIS
jgi:hypothetical protein